ncbi:nuclease-related domain-containing protein [Ureibacillus sp. NPDC094379]
MFDIIIERKIPSKILVLEAIHRRTNKSSELQAFIENQIERAKIGFLGEKKVDRIWQEISFPEQSLLVHSFETVNEFGFSHQMDTIFVNPNYTLVLEIKNVTGYIWYDNEKHQFLRRKKSGEVESFQSPINQVRRHADFVERLGLQLGLTFPIEKAVVIAEPSCVIGPVPNEVPIFHASGLPTELKKWFEKHQNSKLYDEHFHLLTEDILTRHQPKIYKPRYEIPPIRKGTLCNCGRVMKFNRGKFECVCGVRSKEPLLQGLHDYRLLVNEWITNREFREFFKVENEDVVNKILFRMKLTYEGSTKSRKYLIPENIWEENNNILI